MVASDSLLTGGGDWDCCPKIFPMPRGDAVLAFSGDTAWAYPIILQILRWAEDYDQAKNRAYSLERMRSHLEEQINMLFSKIINPVSTPHSDTKILLAGFSVKQNRPRVFATSYNRTTQRTELSECKTATGVVFMGDARGRALELLNRSFHFQRSRRKSRELELALAPRSRKQVKWKPFDILRDIIRDSECRSVGGSPQIVKVSRHLSVMSYAVFWPSRATGDVVLMGRPLLGYEKTRRLVLDPDDHNLYRTWHYLDAPQRLYPPKSDDGEENENP